MIAAILATAALQLAKRPERAGGPSPDILIVVLDDVARVDLAAAQTPTIDALTAQGVSYAAACANPTCAPTRRSLQTGLWHVRGNGQPCSADPETPPLEDVFLPEALPGYSSALLGKWHLGESQMLGFCAPLTQGYDYWLRGSRSNVGDDGCGFSGGTYTNWLREDAGLIGPCSQQVSSEYEPWAVAERFVQAWPIAAAPRLAVVNINLAHSPFHRPPEWLIPGHPPTPTTTDKFRAMIRAYDALIGYMLTVVDLKSTVIVVVGDNGTPPQAAGLESQKAKGTTFERGIRVPLIVAGAGVQDVGRVEHGLVHVVDVFATCLELAGSTASPQQGLSLVPSLHREPQTYHERVLVGARWVLGERGDVASVGADRTKLRWLDDDGDLVVDREQLYDLNVDPFETTNVIGDPAYASQLALHRAFLTANLP